MRPAKLTGDTAARNLEADAMVREAKFHHMVLSLLQHIGPVTSPRRSVTVSCKWTYSTARRYSVPGMPTRSTYSDCRAQRHGAAGVAALEFFGFRSECDLRCQFWRHSHFPDRLQQSR